MNQSITTKILRNSTRSFSFAASQTYLGKHLPCVLQPQNQYQYQYQHQWRQNTTGSASTSSRSPAANTHLDKRRLDVAIVGAPNAGKSQLLNTITSTIISAVSRKRHTTRSGILATHTIMGKTHNTQIVFIDTPGFVQYNSPKDETLYQELVRGAVTSMDYADYTLIMIDAAKKITDELKEELIILMLAAKHSRGRVEDVMLDKDGDIVEVLDVDIQKREKFAIVLNKVDLVHPKEKLLDLAHEIGSLGDACVRYSGQIKNNDQHILKIIENVAKAESDFNGDGLTQPTAQRQLTPKEEEEIAKQFPPVFFVSALKNDGLDDILQHLQSLATATEKFALPPNQKTSMSLVERIEELIREKIYRCLHREVPHSVSQVNRVLQRGKTSDGRYVCRIDQDIIVKTKSHFKLVMGRSGMTLKRIEDTAKRDLVRMLESEGFDEIVLNLHVKLDKSQQHKRELESDRLGVLRTSF